MGRALSEEELAHYREHGYVVVPQSLASADIEALRERYWFVADGAPAGDGSPVAAEGAPPKSMLVMRDVMVAKGLVTPKRPRDAIAKLQDLQDDPVFQAHYLGHVDMLDLAESICGPDLKCVHSMIINKPPDVDGRHPLHQDLLYFPFRPAELIVGMWTALDVCDRDNGTLSIVPGSHTQGLLDHGMPDWQGINHGYFGAKSVDLEQPRLHLMLQPGDSVMFHPLLLHGSGHNRSGRPRLAISAHYASAACQYLPHGKQVAVYRHYRLARGREQPGGI